MRGKVGMKRARTARRAWNDGAGDPSRVCHIIEARL